LLSTPFSQHTFSYRLQSSSLREHNYVTRILRTAISEHLFLRAGRVLIKIIYGLTGTVENHWLAPFPKTGIGGSHRTASEISEGLLTGYRSSPNASHRTVILWKCSQRTAITGPRSRTTAAPTLFTFQGNTPSNSKNFPQSSEVKVFSWKSLYQLYAGS